jgi:hypothetical protein
MIRFRQKNIDSNNPNKTITYYWQRASPAPLDPDAVAFLTAAGITDPTISGSINTLVTDLKLYGLWTKMKAIYPFVGGTATTHKFNLKDPQDTNAAFRLVFVGGWTHSANGALPNGTNAYADTFLNGLSILTNASNHLSYYSRTSSTTGVEVEIGSSNTASNFFQVRSAANYVAGGTVILSFTSTANAQGFWLGSKENAASRRAYKNGVVETLSTANNTTPYENLNIFIGARNDNGVAGFYSDKECALASIGDGLTNAEATNYYTTVQSFQTTLGRQV